MPCFLYLILLVKRLKAMPGVQDVIFLFRRLKAMPGVLDVILLFRRLKKAERYAWFAGCEFIV